MLQRLRTDWGQDKATKGKPAGPNLLTKSSETAIRSKPINVIIEERNFAAPYAFAGGKCNRVRGMHIGTSARFNWIERNKRGSKVIIKSKRRRSYTYST